MEALILAVISILKDARDAAPDDKPIKRVKRVFFGDPVLVAASDLPALVVMPVAQAVTARGTVLDQADSTIKVKLVQSLKDGLGKEDPETLSMVQDAVRTFEDRDDAGKVAAWSVVGALRAKPTLSLDRTATADWSGNYAVEYGFTAERGFVAFETSLTIITKRISPRF